VLIYYKLPPEGRDVKAVAEIIQKTFHTSFEYFPYVQLHESGSCLAWLSRVADHVVISTARRHNRQKRRAASMHSSGNSDHDDRDETTLPARRILIDRVELAEWTDKLDAIPVQERQLILMARIEGLSTVEIAERLNQPNEAVADLLHQAIQCFRGPPED
jgi:RNA polymerase sigma factor (sigma-70 family)